MFHKSRCINCHMAQIVVQNKIEKEVHFLILWFRLRTVWTEKFQVRNPSTPCFLLIVSWCLFWSQCTWNVSLAAPHRAEDL